LERFKDKISKKASSLRHAKRQTGNKTIELQELNELDKKVMGIIGHEYVEGTACPESFPDEVSNSVEKLARGNTSVLNVVPTSIITETPAETYEYYQDDDAIYDNIKVLEASIIDNPLPTDAASCSQYVKLNTQFSTAREVFTNLATINSQQIELITSTLSTIAESNHRMADAMVKMAENDERRTQMEEKLLDLLSTISSKLNYK
ncbi:Myb DNA-bind 5 domain-containing protein, partial [Aphis craccivora]